MISKKNSKTFFSFVVALALILILLFPIIIFLSNTKAVIIDEDFFQREFEKVGTYQRFSKEVADNTTTDLLLYLRFGNEKSDDDAQVLTFFNSRERDHLQEVRDVFQLGNRILNASLFLTLICALCLSMCCFFAKKKNLVDVSSVVYVKNKQINLFQTKNAFGIVLICGALLTNVLLILFTFGAFHFDSAFTLFHEAVFERDTWMLSASDHLIQLYPFDFWLDAAVRILVRSLLFTNALLILGLLLVMHSSENLARKVLV